jgi:phage regulator Rha-like protein
MRKRIGTSTYIQRINTLERKLLKQVKELDDVMEKHSEIMFRLQVVEFALKHCSKTCSRSF